MPDLFQVLSNLGPCEGCPEDVNDDGVVDGQDVVVFHLSAELQTDARSGDASMVELLSSADQRHIWHSKLV